MISVLMPLAVLGLSTLVCHTYSHNPQQKISLNAASSLPCGDCLPGIQGGIEDPLSPNQAKKEANVARVRDEMMMLGLLASFHALLVQPGKVTLPTHHAHYRLHIQSQA